MREVIVVWELPMGLLMVILGVIVAHVAVVLLDVAWLGLPPLAPTLIALVNVAFGGYLIGQGCRKNKLGWGVKSG